MKLRYRLSLLIILLTTAYGSVDAQYAIRPGSDLPKLELRSSGMRAQGRGDLPSSVDNSITLFPGHNQPIRRLMRAGIGHTLPFYV